jgi:RING finger protein 113A
LEAPKSFARNLIDKEPSRFSVLVSLGLKEPTLATPIIKASSSNPNTQQPQTTYTMADSEAPEAPVAIFKKRGAKGKSNLRKRPATPPPAASDSDDSDYSSSEDESGQRVKRRKKNAVVTASSKDAGSSAAGKDLSATVYTADRSVPITSVNDATKQSNWYDEGKDELSAKNLLGSARSKPTSTAGQPDGTYKGLANQTSFIQKNPDAPQRSVGPMKAPTNIRTITITDYAPDVCKDYKQTGFCGVSSPKYSLLRLPAQSY